MADRISSIRRQTRETTVEVVCQLDGNGEAVLALPIGFLEHMLTSLAKHSHFGLSVSGTGDSQVDDHHLCEDVAITLGRALQVAWSRSEAIHRFGTAFVPMDDALALVALDISGRPYLHWQVTLPQARIGSFDTELVAEFMRALAVNAGITLHITLLHGTNTHHIIEAIFKALGQALYQATRIDSALGGVPSSKGAVQWVEQ